MKVANMEDKKPSNIVDLGTAETRATKEMNQRIEDAFRLLVETKHLYQKVSMGVDEILKSVKNQLVQGHHSQFERWWNNTAKTLTPSYQSNLYLVERTGESLLLLQLRLTNVKLFCKTCKRLEAFAPVWFRDEINDLRKPSAGTQGHQTTISPQFQMFLVLYQCQSCRGLPHCFLIRRQGWDLFLEGRSPIEHVEVPSHIPNDEQAHYRDAIIAFNAGKTLAALFYLRTFIEQFARRVTKIEDRTPGSQIMDAYKSTLPIEQRDIMPSLGVAYENLSFCLHGAIEDVEVFMTTREEIERHFDIRRVFKIAEPSHSSEK